MDENIEEYYVGLPEDLVVKVLGPYALIGKLSEGYPNLQVINEYALTLLRLVDGRTKVRTLIEKFCTHYNVECTEEVRAQVLDFILKAREYGHIILSKSPIESKRITDLEMKLGPLELVLEITHRCNLRCIHCYANSSPESSAEMKYEHAIRILDEFSRAGTVVVEITGGEPTIHRDFTHILQYALERFQLVTVLSNGTNISEQIIDVCRKYKNKIVFSITLYSYREEVHDAITSVKGSWKRTVENIKKLVDEGIRVRGSIVYMHLNQYDILKTIEFLKDLGVTIITFSPTLPYGRASRIANDVMKLDYTSIMTQLNEAMRKYRDKLQIVPEEILRFVERHGCGAGWRTLVIDPHGIAKLCVYGGPVFGNVLQEPVEAIIKRSSKMFHIEPPNRNICGECKYLNFCRGCYFRGLTASKLFNIQECKYLKYFEQKYNYTEIS